MFPQFPLYPSNTIASSNYPMTPPFFNETPGNPLFHFQTKGKQKFEDGTSYDGEFQNGLMHGKGILTGLDFVYEGEFQNGMMHGKGIVKYKDQSIYTGDMCRNALTGLGTIIYPTGQALSGYFVDGAVNGQGILCFPNEYRYEGEFKNSKPHGKGIKKYTGGGKYEGSFREGLQHGKGILNYANGDRYEGEFKEDKFNGKGVLKFVNGPLCKGIFENGEMNSGLVKFSDGSQYEGQLKNRKYNGSGTLKTSNGRKFIGDFKDHEICGEGVLVLPNGDQCFGCFQFGELSGDGKYVFKSGKTFHVDWHSNDLVTFVLPEGVKKSCVLGSHGVGALIKVFLNNQDQMSFSHKEYVQSLVQNDGFDDLAGIAEVCLDSLKEHGFKMDTLTSDQIDVFASVTEKREWYISANQGIKEGILNFFKKIKIDHKSTYTNLLAQEAWRLFGQFFMFMDNELIHDLNKKKALNEFNGIKFACAASIPERMKGILSILLYNTKFSNAFLSQRNMILEEYMADFLKFCEKNSAPKIPESFEIHLRPWLANFLSKEFGFHTIHESKTDKHDDSSFLGYSPDIKERCILFFKNKLQKDWPLTTIEDVTARMTAVLMPFQNKPALSPRDFEFINENVFDVFSPVLSGKVDEFDNRLELYFHQDVDGKYRLNQQIFIDIHYLVARCLEEIGYYRKKEPEVV